MMRFRWFESHSMMRHIEVNLTFSMALNFVAIVLAMLAVLDPVGGALVRNCGSVFVIVNSAFLLKWRQKGRWSRARKARMHRYVCS